MAAAVPPLTWWKMRPSFRCSLLLHSLRVRLIRFLNTGDAHVFAICVTRPLRTSATASGRLGSPEALGETPSRLCKLPAESGDLRWEEGEEDNCVRSKVRFVSSSESDSESCSRSQSSVSPDCPVTHSHASVQLQPPSHRGWAGPHGHHPESVNWGGGGMIWEGDSEEDLSQSTSWTQRPWMTGRSSLLSGLHRFDFLRCFLRRR